MTTLHEAAQQAIVTITNTLGCFQAAEGEGLGEALAETTDERLKDLVSRRLLYAIEGAEPTIEALRSALEQQEDTTHELTHAQCLTKYANAKKCIGEWIEAHSKLNDETTLDFIRQQSRIDELQHKLNAAEARERHTRSTLNKLLARPAEHLKLLQDTQRTSDAFCARKIAQQVEPVAWYSDDWKIICRADERVFWKSVAVNPLYDAPAPQPVVKTPPEWWSAVENILTEYGLDAISFVADFKKASGDYPAQIKKDISAPQAQQDKLPVNWAAMIHYPECWDTAAYPTLSDAIHVCLAWSGCSVCKPRVEKAQDFELPEPAIRECVAGKVVTGYTADQMREAVAKHASGVSE